ncbi:MAG TPA: restriction endonuclease [Mycobacteriales bacterium]|nr:restriction endonuclease [Mycobacteriales bacterium]
MSRKDKRGPDPILDWQGAELAALRWMQKHGYADAALTRRGADAGVDVVARKALAQVKWQQPAISRPDLQRLVGARGEGRQRLLFFSGSPYSTPASQYAHQMKMCLFALHPDGEISAVNEAARKLVAPRSAWSLGPLPTTTPGQRGDDDGLIVRRPTGTVPWPGDPGLKG